ncbi:MAG: phosphopyruvate hydratase [Ruminococcaceae bacterium]|nr:phosphopyruvate hydratase [Oscillospiraceae bacterium]
MTDATVSKCHAREILDSRGNPTVEAVVVLSDGTSAYASAPSGASTGIYEAHEKRDKDKSRYGGKGVLTAVGYVNDVISPALLGMDPADQGKLDRTLNKLDGTENKSRIGANAILAVSLAAARAAAMRNGLPLYKQLGGIDSYRLPVPMMNILNGGAHASNNIEIQEFMIVPVGIDSFSDALRAGAEIYHELGRLLKSKGLSTGVGDEGGFAPSLKDDNDAIDLICEAIKGAGYTTEEIRIALDTAASEWFDENEGIYILPKRQKKFTSDELVEHWVSLCEKYPMIMSIEDGLDQRDMDGWRELTKKLGDKIMLVGDDLFVTNTERLKMGIERKIANTILIKPNQIGTLSETLDVIHMAQNAGYRTIISHRSGETEDTAIADIAVAVNAPFIKTGAPCRGERVAKYNRLLRIADELASSGSYGFKDMPSATSKNFTNI